MSSTVGLLVGWVADRGVGDPTRWHPVAGLGRMAAGWERILYRDDRRRGALWVLAILAAVAAPVALAARRWPTATTAAVLSTALGGNSLRRAAARVASALDDHDLHRARRELRALVSRETDELDAVEVARATIESLAENTVDAVVAPLWWTAVGGPVAVAIHRVADTLDSMVGYRIPRYAHFGWAAARLDDALAYLPARLTVILTALLAPSEGRRTSAVLTAARRYGPRHPSPNAGRAQAAVAATLGVRLGGGPHRHGGIDDPRPALGDGCDPAIPDIHRAIRLAHRTELLAVAAATGVRWALDRWTSRSRASRRSGR